MIRLAIRVPRGQAEIVLAELLELAPSGVEECDAGAGAVEFAVYGAPGELPELPDLEAICAGAPLEVSTRELPDDWHERWKEFHRPVVIAAPSRAPGDEVPALRIRPPWEPAAPAASDPPLEIVIDPGQAFGTGGHASTRLCLQLLLELRSQGHRLGPLLDVGTGSGVLAIAGGLLGFAPLLGLDHERESVEAAAENAAENGIELEVRRYDLRSDPLPWLGEGASDDLPPEPVLLTANLLRPLLLALAGSLARAPAELIVGGLLPEETDEVCEAFASRLGMRERLRREEGGWTAAWLSSG